MNGQPPFWVVIVKCADCKRHAPAFLPRGQVTANHLCRECDAKVSQWIAEQGVNRGTIQGEILVHAAREFIGVKFHWGGRDRNGLDCVGLLLACLHGLEWTTWTPPNYGRHIEPNALYGALKRFCDRVDLGSGLSIYETGAELREAGDLLLFAVHGRPQHLGIDNGQGGMIHAHEAAGRVVEEPISPSWARRLVGVWRWHGEQ